MFSLKENNPVMQSYSLFKKYRECSQYLLEIAVNVAFSLLAFSLITSCLVFLSILEKCSALVWLLLHYLFNYCVYLAFPVCFCFLFFSNGSEI